MMDKRINCTQCSIALVETSIAQENEPRTRRIELIIKYLAWDFVCSAPNHQPSTWHFA